MARPLRIHAPGVPFHAMARGNGKQRIFIDRPDCLHFLDLLETATKRFAVECHAYCLMPTHFHLMLRPGPHPIWRMMQQLNSSYADYFNWKHRRVGHVLQGRYKGLLVEGDDYFLRGIRYIVRNPVAAGLAREPSAWRWSSYRATAGLMAAPAFLSLDAVLAMFDSMDRKRAQQQFVDFGAIPEDTEPFLSALFVGSERFGRTLSPKLEPIREVRDHTYRERYADRPPLSALLTTGQGELQRSRAIEAAYLRHAYTLREIAAVVGCHPATIWRRVRRMSEPPPLVDARQKKPA